MEDADQLRINNFALTYAEALTATARLLVPFDGRPIIGNVAMRSADLAPVGRALQQLAGRFNLDIVLDAARGTQRIAANFSGNNIRYGPTAAPIAGVDALRATSRRPMCKRSAGSGQISAPATSLPRAEICRLCRCGDGGA